MSELVPLEALTGLLFEKRDFRQGGVFGEREGGRSGEEEVEGDDGG
jgi:hypothetical protein